MSNQKLQQKFKTVVGKPRYIEFKIPTEWDFVAIETVCNTSSGGTPSRKIKEYFQGKIPWITTSELKDNLIYDTEEKITRSALDSSSCKRFPKDILIVAMYGATIGQTGISKIEATTNQACCVFLPKKEKTIDPYFLQQFFILQQPLIVSLGEGTGQPNISQDFLKKFFIPVAKFSEQQKIASILSNVDSQIESLQSKKSQLQKTNRGLMQKLLTGQIRARS